MSASHLAPASSHPGDNPFATPSQLSIRSAECPEAPAVGPAPRSTSSGNDFEMQNGAAGSSVARGTKAPFFSRWRQVDERAYLATVGRVLPSKDWKSEKAGELQGQRRRAPAWACTIISGIIALIIVIVIVVPVAVVYSRENSSNSNAGDSKPSSPGGPAPIPNSNVVSLKQGQYRGTALPNGITQFLGMQYAAPPVDDLRFAAPQPPVTFDGVQAATKFAPGCHGAGAFNSNQDEDCLYLDVFAPTNTTDQSKLPVYFFIQGGGLQDSAVHYNLSNFVAASGFKIITVTITYRVNAFGFLASSEIQKGASLNNGLKDQRMALQWVQENIAAFGGDPGHVVLAGESAGAGSSVMQMMAYGGRDDHLFHAAALQSQSLQAVRDVKSSQYQYDYIVGNTSCHDSKDTLKCLRGVSIQGLVSAIKNSPFPDGAGGNPVFPYNPVVDGDFLKRHPIPAYEQGEYVSVPTIFGDDTDEGSVFTPKTISTQKQSEDFLRNTFPLINSTMLKQYDNLYNLSDTSSDNYWQKVAGAYGETRYTCPGLQLSSLVQKNNSKVWYFHYDVEDAAAEAAGLGVKHGSEVIAIFGPSQDAPVSYKTGGNNSGVVPLMQAYWTSFIKNFDPNTDKVAEAPNWDQWTGNNRLHIVANGTAMEGVDDGLAQRCKFLNGIAANIGQ